MAKAILKKLDQVEEDAMTGVKPSVSTDPPPSYLSVSKAFSKKVFLKVHPFLTSLTA
jgi:hypothetical protein